MDSQNAAAISPVRITRAAFLIAVCVVLGYLFMPVPNLEMITAGIFLSGLWMGPLYGLLVGFTAELIYSLFNPMGFPPPPLLVTQLMSMSLTGWAGGLMRDAIVGRRFFARGSWKSHFVLAGVGAVLTFVFDLLTNLSFPIAAGFTPNQFRLALIMGLPFAAVHISVNALIFALIIPVFLNRFPNWRAP